LPLRAWGIHSTCFCITALPGSDQAGLDVMHTCITLHKLPLLLPLRRLSRQMASLILRYPELLTITAVDGIPFPGYDTALPGTTLAELNSPKEEV